MENYRWWKTDKIVQSDNSIRFIDRWKSNREIYIDSCGGVQIYEYNDDFTVWDKQSEEKIESTNYWYIEHIQRFIDEMQEVVKIVKDTMGEEWLD